MMTNQTNEMITNFKVIEPSQYEESVGLMLITNVTCRYTLADVVIYYVSFTNGTDTFTAVSFNDETLNYINRVVLGTLIYDSRYNNYKLTYCMLPPESYQGSIQSNEISAEINDEKVTRLIAEHNIESLLDLLLPNIANCPNALLGKAIACSAIIAAKNINTSTDTSLNEPTIRAIVYVNTFNNIFSKVIIENKEKYKQYKYALIGVTVLLPREYRVLFEMLQVIISNYIDPLFKGVVNK